MDAVTSSNLQNVKLNTNQVNIKKPEETTTQNEEKDKEGLDKTLAALAIGGAALVGIGIALNKGKTFKLQDVNFNKGEACFATGRNKGEKFTGVIKDSKNGNQFKITYKDGVIQKSKVTGETNLEKIYLYDDNGNMIKVVKNGDEIDIEKLKKGAADKKAKPEAPKPETPANKKEGGVEPKQQPPTEKIDPEYEDTLKQGEKWADEAKKAQEIEEQKLADEALEKAIGPKANKTQEDIDEFAYQLKQAEKLEEAKNRSGNLKERIKTIKSDYANDIKFFSKEQIKQMNQRAKMIQNTLSKEQIAALGDEQIYSLLRNLGCSKKEFKTVLDLLQKFDNDKLKNISIGSYHEAFIGNLFDAAMNPEEAERILKWYRK